MRRRRKQYEKPDKKRAAYFRPASGRGFVGGYTGGLNFARKVLTTGECDVLILDEILGILDEGIISLEELAALIGHARQMETCLILTGTVYPSALDDYVDEITRIQTRYEDRNSVDNPQEQC